MSKRASVWRPLRLRVSPSLNALPQHAIAWYRHSIRKSDADYLENCRRKRNVVEYNRVGEASEADADELVKFGEELMTEVRKWLASKHPELV